MSAGRVLVALVVVLSILGATAGPAAADVRGSPSLSATLSEDTVTAGETTTLQVTLSNAGDLSQASTTNPALNERVTTARGVTARMRAPSAPLTVHTGRQSVGSVADGAAVPVPFRVSIDEGADPGRYSVLVDVEYTYTSQVGEPNGSAVTRTDEETFRLTVVVADRARVRVVDATTDVAPGGTGTLSLTVENGGTAAARNATLSLTSANAALSLDGGQTASRYVGTWAPGERRTLEYVVTASERATGGSYPVDLVATFEDEDGQPVQTAPRTVAVEPGRGQFVVTGVRSDVAVGGSGTVALSMRNDGPRARAATVTLRSPNAALAVDGGQTASRYVGTWAHGETRTVSYDLAAADGAGPYRYTLAAVVGYETAGGARATSPATNLGVAPAAAPEFAVGNVSSALHVGEDGRLRGTVVNRGPNRARGVVVQLADAPPTVRTAEPSYAVGDLAPGERASFSFPVTVGPQAEAGPRQFSLAVAYETADGTAASADPIRVRQRVGRRRDRLRFEPVNATFAVDTSDRLVVRVTNEGDEPLRDVSAAVSPAPPLSSAAPTSFVPRLQPGETAVLAFEVTVSEDAVETTQAIPVNVTAERADGSTVRFAPQLVAVAVVEPSGPATDVATLVVGTVVVVVVLGAGWWWLRR
ncbi:MAG: COG1361 S-layer family protein [Haloarculaceae archaeon]